MLCSKVIPGPENQDDQPDQTINIETISSDECEQENMNKTDIIRPVKRENISYDEHQKSKKRTIKLESHDCDNNDNNVDNLNANLVIFKFYKTYLNFVKF